MGHRCIPPFYYFIIIQEREERKITAEIKKAAKAGRQSQVRILAKDLIRIRKSKDKLLQMARSDRCPLFYLFYFIYFPRRLC